MARQQPIELFMPPNMLKAKVGGGLGGIDLGAIKRAEAAVEDLSGQFDAWLSNDVQALVAARTAFAANPGAAERAALLRAAHDIKGQAATYNYPLIARVAASLSRLLAELPDESEPPLKLIDAHVSAAQVIHRQGLREIDNRMAQMLCSELDARVGEALAKKP